jgi:small subunit ribosomal protein S20
MPNIKSAKKRVQIGKRNEARNLAKKSAMRTAIRAVREAAEAKDSKVAQEKLSVAYQAIDKAAKANIIHKKTAARYKSRLASKLKAVK